MQERNDRQRCPVCGKGVFTDVVYEDREPDGTKLRLTGDSYEVLLFSCGHEVRGTPLATADADEGRATVPGTAPQSTLFDYAGFERRFRGDPEVVVEATYGWYWVVDLLQANGARVHLANPQGLNWGQRRVKNDERDAIDLADMLRLGRLPEAWIAPPATRELRELVRYRAKLVGLRSGLKAQVHAVMAKEGVLPTVADMFCGQGNARLDDLSEHLGFELEAEGLDTIGGLVFNRLGYLPPSGTRFEMPRLAITVRRAGRKRIEEILLEKTACLDPEQDEGNGATAP
jgi:hypothetical protein